MGAGNTRINNSFTDNPSIPEIVSDRLYDSIVKIKGNNKIGTGFFMKILIDEKEKKYKYYLLTCSHIISQNMINSNEAFKIFYGKNDQQENEINLNENLRFIKSFKNLDITIIEIIDNDKIPKNKFLSPDYNYKYGFDSYKNEKIYIAGYPMKGEYEGRHISVGKITESIENFEFKHDASTMEGSSGSPICSEKQFVIGVHKQGDKKKKINYGTFIGALLNELEKEHIGKRERDKKSKKGAKKKYCNLEEYKNKFFYSHKLILNYYHSQNEDNFYQKLKEFKEFASNPDNTELKPDFFDIMVNFKDVDKENEDFLKIFLQDKGLIKNFNKAIRNDDKSLFNKLCYFIGGFLKSLDNTKYGLKQDMKLYRGDKMTYDDLLKFRTNIDQILVYKGFCSASKDRGIATVYTRSHDDLNSFSVIITINYKYKEDWTPYCFDVENFSKYEEQKKVIFSMFSCFKIKKVSIEEKNKKAEIILDSLGRKKEIEKKIFSYKEEVSKLEFIENNDVIDIKNIVLK